MTQDRTARTSLVLIALVLVLFSLHFAATIMAPAAFAAFVIAVVWPFQRALQAWMPAVLATVVTLFVIVAAVGILVYLLAWGFGLVVEWFIANTSRFQALYVQATDWLAQHGIMLRTFMAENYNAGWIVGPAREIGSRSYGLISFVVILFTFVAIGLLEVDLVRRNIQELEDAAFTQSLMRASQDIATKFQTYMLVRSAMSVLTGFTVWCFALAAGIELATAWGVITFVFNYVPFLGPLFATVFPTIFALVQFGSWELAIIIFVILNTIQFVTGSYIEPRIAGAALSISPSVVLFAVFFWSLLWGIPGAFIGVPIVIAVIAVCNEHESAKWLAALLSGRREDAPRVTAQWNGQ